MSPDTVLRISGSLSLFGPVHGCQLWTYGATTYQGPYSPCNTGLSSIICSGFINTTIVGIHYLEFTFSNSKFTLINPTVADMLSLNGYQAKSHIIVEEIHVQVPITN